MRAGSAIVGAGTDRRSWLLLAFVLAAFLVPVLAGIARGTAFGYDESIYAQLSRALAGGPAAVGAGTYRPPGLGVLGLPAALAAGSEWSFRLVGALGGACLVTATWWLARMAGGRGAALLASAAVAAAWPVQIESTTFLTDVPAAALVVGAAALTWRTVSGVDGRSEWVWLGLLAAAAFFLRFGSIISLAGIASAGLLVGSAVARVSIARAVGLCAGLLLPHAIHATTTTGTPWGIVSAAQRAAGEGAGVDALLAYATLLPGPLMGPLAGVLAILGIVAVARAAVSPGSGASIARFLGIAAIGPMVVLVASSHAEPRYAIVPMTLLASLGATRIGARIGALALPRPALRAAVAVLALAVLLGGAAMTLIAIDRRVAAWDWTRDVALAINADAGGARCAILASDAPIMAWYGRCAASTFGSPPSFDAFDASAEARGYIVLRADDHHQPPATAIDALRDRVEPWRTFTDRNGAVAATVYRTRDDAR